MMRGKQPFRSSLLSLPAKADSMIIR
jgi:hypothetical protein